MRHLLLLLLIITLHSACQTEGKKNGKGDKSTSQEDSSEKKMDGFSGQTLFKEFKFGQNMDEFKQTGKYEDCSDFFSVPALCIEGVTFLDTDYSAGLIFTDDKLQKVILYTEYSEEIYKSLPASLQKNNFQLVMLSDQSERIDVLLSAKNQKQEEFLENLSDFETRMLSGSDGLIGFLEIKDIKKDVFQYSSIPELVLDLPPSAREIDILMLNDENNKRYLALSFTLVKYELDNMGKKENF